MDFINLTLVVQIFHFLIAYLILSRLLLKPAVSIIQGEEKKEEVLISNAKVEQKNIQEKEIHKEEFWKKSLEEFEKAKPETEKAFKKEKFVWKTIKPLELSEESINNIKNRYETLIIDKAKDV